MCHGCLGRRQDSCGLRAKPNRKCGDAADRKKYNWDHLAFRLESDLRLHPLAPKLMRLAASVIVLAGCRGRSWFPVAAETVDIASSHAESSGGYGYSP